MKFKSVFLLSLFAAVLITGIDSTAYAKRKNGGVIKLEVTTIEGRVQKPNAFFINTRQSMVYKSMEIKDNFIPEISRVVDSGDF